MPCDSILYPLTMLTLHTSSSDDGRNADPNDVNIGPTAEPIDLVWRVYQNYVEVSEL